MAAQLLLLHLAAASHLAAPSAGHVPRSHHCYCHAADLQACLSMSMNCSWPLCALELLAVIFCACCAALLACQADVYDLHAKVQVHTMSCKNLG